MEVVDADEVLAGEWVFPREVAVQVALRGDESARSNLAYVTRYVEVQEILAEDDCPAVVDSLIVNEHLHKSVAAKLSFRPEASVMEDLWEGSTHAPDEDYSVRFFMLWAGPDAIARMLPDCDAEVVRGLADNWEGSVRSLGEAVLLVKR